MKSNHHCKYRNFFLGSVLIGFFSCSSTEEPISVANYPSFECKSFQIEERLFTDPPPSDLVGCGRSKKYIGQINCDNQRNIRIDASYWNCSGKEWIDVSVNGNKIRVVETEITKAGNGGLTLAGVDHHCLHYYKTSYESIWDFFSGDLTSVPHCFDWKHGTIQSY